MRALAQDDCGIAAGRVEQDLCGADLGAEQLELCSLLVESFEPFGQLVDTPLIDGRECRGQDAGQRFGVEVLGQFGASQLEQCVHEGVVAFG